jgi:hypothetical protein
LCSGSKASPCFKPFWIPKVLECLPATELMVKPWFDCW